MAEDFLLNRVDGVHVAGGTGEEDRGHVVAYVLADALLHRAGKVRRDAEIAAVGGMAGEVIGDGLPSLIFTDQRQHIELGISRAFRREFVPLLRFQLPAIPRVPVFDHAAALAHALGLALRGSEPARREIAHPDRHRLRDGRDELVLVVAPQRTAMRVGGANDDVASDPVFPFRAANNFDLKNPRGPRLRVERFVRQPLNRR